MRDRSRARRPSKRLVLLSLAVTAGVSGLGLAGWYPSRRLKVLIWLPVLLIALLIFLRWFYAQVAAGALPESRVGSDGQGQGCVPGVSSASASERRRHVLWQKGRTARAVRVGFALGCLLIAFSPVVCNYNDRVRDLRRRAGGDESSYFMRQDIASLFIEGGMYLVLGGTFAIWRLRRVRGDWAQRRTSLDFLPPYIFLAKPIGSALVALPFVFVIYDTKVVRDPMSFDRYLTLTMMSMAVLFGVSFVLFLRARHRFKLPDGVRDDCCQCGYNLTGNTSGVCPECATTVEA